MKESVKAVTGDDATKFALAAPGDNDTGGLSVIDFRSAAPEASAIIKESPRGCKVFFLRIYITAKIAPAITRETK